MRQAYHRGEYELGTPFWIMTINRGTEAKMKEKARNRQFCLARYADRRWPLAKFSFSNRQTEEGVEVYATYWGEAKDNRSKAQWKRRRREKNPRTRAP